MRDDTFEVVFTNGLRSIQYALSAEQAKILAQAEAIKNGNDFIVEEVNLISR